MKSRHVRGVEYVEQSLEKTVPLVIATVVNVETAFRRPEAKTAVVERDRQHIDPMGARTY